MHSRELYDQLLQAFTRTLPEEEKRAAIRWLLEERTGLKAADLLTGKEIPLLPRHFEQELKRLNAGEPLQYILGHGYFYGRRFRVSSAVLIPRPETEWIVEKVVHHAGKEFSGSLLDVGTGSGCIAITLALELPHANVFATEVDAHALSVARDNARQLHAAVNFQQHDILTEELSFPAMDIVVSNPPYIREAERVTMDIQVTGFEPHRALFVPDDNSMIFHRVLAQKAKLILKPGGLLCMEINEALSRMTADTVRDAGYSDVTIHQDLDGKDRYVTALATA
ncbi:MAG: peptide chain release factor N(5)-glutamine methyltransferase [Cyclobacteriaceae bacterium]|nr:peptide chain release factor N(5)-glutamine methyltransferase [Cyclobacteriaceae bacterium]